MLMILSINILHLYEFSTAAIGIIKKAFGVMRHRYPLRDKHDNIATAIWSQRPSHDPIKTTAHSNQTESWYLRSYSQAF